MHVSVQPDNPFVNNANFFHGFPVHEIAVALPSTVVLATWLTGCYKKFEFKLGPVQKRARCRYQCYLMCRYE